MESEDIDSKVCHPCGVFLKEPYIRCCLCQPPFCFLCLACFCKGKEYEPHESNHNYEIIRNNFTLLQKNWTAAEEMQLLDAILNHGFGNWVEISRQLQTKTAAECESHYLEHYVFNPKPPLEPVRTTKSSFEVHATPIAYFPRHNPIRPMQDNKLYTEMAGYMAARGDFNVEYDNYAELDIKDIDFTKIELDVRNEDQIKIAMVDIYRSRQKERSRRKYVVRNLGLISQEVTAYFMRNFESALGPNRNLAEKFVPLMRLVPFEKFLKFMLSLCNEQRLRKRISELKLCRENGLKHLHSVGTFAKMKNQREKFTHKGLLLGDVLNNLRDESACQNWLQRQSMIETKAGLSDSPVVGSTRKSAPPLNINEYPGCEKLTPAEKELCSTNRLLPESFVQFKQTLISECAKLGRLRLAEARNLIKIDVNKTRKLYDFLIAEKLIWK